MRSAYYTVDLEEYIEVKIEWPEYPWDDGNYNSPMEKETQSDQEIGMLINTPTC